MIFYVGDGVQIKTGKFKGLDALVRNMHGSDLVDVEFDGGERRSYSERTLMLVNSGPVRLRAEGALTGRFVKCPRCPVQTSPERLRAHVEAHSAASQPETADQLYNLYTDILCVSGPWGSEARLVWTGLADLWARIYDCAIAENAPTWARHGALVQRDRYAELAQH